MADPIPPLWVAQEIVERWSRCAAECDGMFADLDRLQKQNRIDDAEYQVLSSKWAALSALMDQGLAGAKQRLQASREAEQ